MVFLTSRKRGWLCVNSHELKVWNQGPLFTQDWRPMTIAFQALIVRKDGDCPSSLQTQRWRHNGPKKTSWMKSLHGVLHGGLWIRFHGLPEFSSSPPPRGGRNANFRRPWFFQYFFQHDNYHDILHEIFQNKFQDNTPPSCYLKLVEFETYYIKPSPPLLFLPTNYATVLQHGPFSLHTMFEGPWLHKMAFPTPMVRPLDESQGSSPLQGHGSWLVCEVTLNKDVISFTLQRTSFSPKISRISSAVFFNNPYSASTSQQLPTHLMFKQSLNTACF